MTLKYVHFHSECDDCGVDTVREVREYYMVHDQLWRQARRRSTKPKLPRTATLCIGCLEERLGRQLTRKDFEAVYPPWSKRLQDRAELEDSPPVRVQKVKKRLATFASLRHVRPDLTDKEIRQELKRRADARRAERQKTQDRRGGNAA